MKSAIISHNRNRHKTRRTISLLLLLAASVCLLCGCESILSLRDTEGTRKPKQTASTAKRPEQTALPATAEPAPEPVTEAESTEAETEPTEETPSTEPASTEPETTAAPEPAETEPELPQKPFTYHGLVELTAIDDSFVIDQRYATTDNFTGIQQYDRELCLVQEDIVDMLIAANDMAKQHGLHLKIWDAYRPISVQQALHDSAPEELAPYVPAPSPYSMHARGITVDLTLCYPDGTELDMPTAFDDFSTAANSDYDGASEEQIANRELLNEIMSAAGFKRSKLEWWHFDGPNRDHYEILDVSFAEFEAARDA